MIHVGQPTLRGNEAQYVNDVLTSTRLTMGPYTARFEQVFAEYIGVKYAFATTSGTTALHLALVALGIGPGDEVLVPTLSFVATANAVAYTGATPVFVDVDSETWNIDTPHAARLVTERTRAIIPVHLYGLPADMRAIRDVARVCNLHIIEDAAEALGSAINGRKVGSFGDVACFSFYGNKTITTGEGGMITTDMHDIADAIHLLRGQAQSRTKRYWHEDIGFNYRMTDLQAAVGCAQMEQLPALLKRRRDIALLYRRSLADVEFQPVMPGYEHGWWGFTILLDREVNRDGLMRDLLARDIETRPMFYPIHTMPMYTTTRVLPVAEGLAQRGIMLPMHADLTDNDVRFISESVMVSMYANQRAA